ncbi:MAG TPA: sigma 54-interacting transcriptional regulator [Candidatus Acidoferrum sp.]|jgi:formate hydrogenlyase transcriptional activator
MADSTISPAEAAPSLVLDHSRRQLEALLDVSEIIAQHRDLKTLFHELAARLRSVVDSDFLTLVLHDPVKNVMRLHVLETSSEHEHGKMPGMEHPVEGSPSGWVLQTQQPFIVEDVLTEIRFKEFLTRLSQEGVRSFAALPLTTAQRRLGSMGFGRLRPQAISDSDIQFMQRVAAQVAVAVDNALNFESAQAYQQQLAEQRDRLQVLLDINNVLVTSRELSDLFRGIVSALTRVIHHDYTSLALLDSSTNRLRIHALDFDGSDTLFAGKEITVALDQSPAGRCMLTAKPAIFHGPELDQFPAELVRILRDKGLTSACCVPLISKGRAFGALNLASRRVDAFTDADAELLGRVAAQIAIAVENALAFKEIDSLKNKLAVEKHYLEEEIRSEFNFEEIVGESAAIKSALAKVELAAPGDTTVLILGETGTGKELIARAIHNLSPRRERTFVKINCAAIPGGLLESELFGHEKGAFTGAIAQKVGRFELADRGTIFLDEVGDIPLELQPKLLRVLQEHEFERLGATRTVRVDVRVVAATNADLGRLVAERKFRSDLFYRLNVFPIQIPALRERREDIPLLVRYFVQKFSRGMNKTVQYIPADAMDALVMYSWPGNIRELENLLERAVILSPGKELRVPVSELRNSAAGAAVEESPLIASASSPIPTLEEAERQHILRALRRAEWRIAGPNGAANLLGMKRTTLQARIRKLGIRRPV